MPTLVADDAFPSRVEQTILPGDSTLISSVALMVVNFADFAEVAPIVVPSIVPPFISALAKVVVPESVKPFTFAEPLDTSVVNFPVVELVAPIVVPSMVPPFISVFVITAFDKLVVPVSVKPFTLTVVNLPAFGISLPILVPSILPPFISTFGRTTLPDPFN